MSGLRSHFQKGDMLAIAGVVLLAALVFLVFLPRGDAPAASVENIKYAKESVAIACGKEKAEAIVGALRTKMVDTLITDEYTARRVLEHS